MAFRLGDVIVAGFFMNSRNFSTHGRLLLRGAEMPVSFELTGNPCPDLRGKKLEFEVPENDRAPSDEDRRLAAAFKPMQIGVTGEMTAGRKVRTFDCSFEEFYHRCKIGEPPPTRWELCLYLEWYSQNGRVVIELPMSKLRFLSEEEAAARDQAEEDSFEAETKAWDGELESPESEPPGDEPGPAEEYSISEIEEDADEGYDLIPGDLDLELERQARRTDWEIAGDSPIVVKLRDESELMDDMLDRGKQTPIQEFLADLDLPSPESVATEARAEEALSTALMKLALAGIAFHVCEHCTIREAYRILIEEVCAKAGAYKPLIGTGWVQNYCTSDYCKRCNEGDPAPE
jgi:hypothetical protein